MTTMTTSALPSVDTLRTRALDALRAVGWRGELGEPGADGLPASTPITGEVLFTVGETTAVPADEAIAEAAQAFTTWRTTPAPARGALVARLGELLVEQVEVRHPPECATVAGWTCAVPSTQGGTGSSRC